jgi:hypothetical protein
MHAMRETPFKRDPTREIVVEFGARTRLRQVLLDPGQIVLGLREACASATGKY